MLYEVITNDMELIGIPHRVVVGERGLDAGTLEYRDRRAEDGWHFLTSGDQEPIDRLTAAIGFEYRYDEAMRQFVHAAGIVVATPDGRLSRYFRITSYNVCYTKLLRTTWSTTAASARGTAPTTARTRRNNFV